MIYSNKRSEHFSKKLHAGHHLAEPANVRVHDVQEEGDNDEHGQGQAQGGEGPDPAVLIDQLLFQGFDGILMKRGETVDFLSVAIFQGRKNYVNPGSEGC